MTHVYAAYRRWRGLDGQAETMVIPDRFHWGAAIFGPFWALFRGHWRAAAILGAGWAVAGLLAFAAGPLGAPTIWLIAAWWTGASARQLESLWLDDAGWRLDGLVVADGLDAAEARLIGDDAARLGGAERRW